MNKVAIITGVTGMDGSLLSDLLLSKDYKVYGLKRRTSSNTLGNVSHLANHPKFEIVEGDIEDLSCLTRLTKLARADEFYHMASMSHVGSSFDQPLYTAKVTGLATLNCLEAIRLSGINTKFLFAATSEMFGGTEYAGNQPLNESTPFHPRSPYGVAKLFGYWSTVNYREAWKLFACNSICFNHECERRGPNFVTRKITLGIRDILDNKKDCIYLGNLDAKRDWGWAPDFVNGMYMMLQHNQPSDYVLATGKAYSVREFCQLAFEHAGLGDYQKYIKIDQSLYRAAEVNVLLGDYSKAERVLGWKPEKTFNRLVKDMVDFDLGPQAN